MAFGRGLMFSTVPLSNHDPTVRSKHRAWRISRSEAAHHGQVALMIFRGILDELTVAPPRTRPRLQQAMRNAVLRYLTPVLAESKRAA
jgi:hypothetical protein